MSSRRRNTSPRVQTTRNYDVACWGFNVADESPEAGLSRHVLSVAGGNSGGNAMNLNNAAIDTQILALKAAKTDAERKAAFEKILTDLEGRSSLDRLQQQSRGHRVNSKKVKGLKYNVVHHASCSTRPGSTRNHQRTQNFTGVPAGTPVSFGRRAAGVAEAPARRVE